MHKIRFAAIPLLFALLCGCGQKTVNAAPEEAPEMLPAETAAAPRESLVSFTKEEGPEEGILLTCWSYAGTEAAEFYTVLFPVPEEFPYPAGTVYEGAKAALLGGTVMGDGESGTAEYVLIKKDGGPETLLTLMYSRDRVALLELDDGMLSFCRQDKNTGLWTVVFTDDGPLGFADAALMLEGILETYGMVPVLEAYGLAPGEALDLSPVTE